MDSEDDKFTKIQVSSLTDEEEAEQLLQTSIRVSDRLWDNATFLSEEQRERRKDYDTKKALTEFCNGDLIKDARIRRKRQECINRFVDYNNEPGVKECWSELVKLKDMVQAKEQELFLLRPEPVFRGSVRDLGDIMTLLGKPIDVYGELRRKVKVSYDQSADDDRDTEIHHLLGHIKVDLDPALLQLYESNVVWIRNCVLMYSMLDTSHDPEIVLTDVWKSVWYPTIEMYNLL
jgi:hypothetical protein